MARRSVLLLLGLHAASAAPSSAGSAPAPLRLTVGAGPTLPLPHIWENTGWCPPDSQSSALAMANYSLQEASWQQHALIAAVPNRGLKYVRIHNLLNLITISAGAAATHPIPPAAYNWSLLDSTLDMVAGEHKLRIGFEIMGNPRTSPSSRVGVYTSWRAPEQLEGWRNMVKALASRYIARYGAAAVASWRFETWNEPDHACDPVKKMKANIVCDEQSWLGYWDACSDGLQQASPAGSPLVFGGPGSGGGTATSWVLPALVRHLAAKKRATGRYGCDYLQWHNKGMLPGERSPPDEHFPDGKTATTCNSYVDLALVESVLAEEPEVAAALPMGNEEADMIGGWNHQLPWHSDAYNAAGLVRLLAMHEDMVNANKTLSAQGVKLGYHANDNAFLNYGDAWFTQRTLVTRFEMNLTHTVEVVRKPTINTMAMLSLLGNTRHPVTWSGMPAGTPAVQPATPTSAPFGAIATSGVASDQEADGVSHVSVVLWNSRGTQPCVADCEANVTVDVAALIPAGTSADRVSIRVLRLDQQHGNPAAVFLAQRGGQPKKKPYPTAAEFEAIRAAAELPSCWPAGLSASAGGPSTCAGMYAIGGATVTLPLPQPSTALLHVCVAPPGGAPSTLSPPTNLRLRTTTTPGEVFVRWDDVPTKCVGKFELFFGGNTSASIMPGETLFTAFVHQQRAAVASGCYSVGWVDAWGHSSPPSAPVCVKDGATQPYVNA